MPKPNIAQRYDPAVPVDSIRPHPNNVNIGDVGAISVSMEQNGFYGAVLVQDSTGLIIAGKHRWITAQQLGDSTVPVLFMDVDDDRALRIMLADNRTARLGHDDEHALAELLASLSSTEAGLAGTGFDGDDFDQLLKDLQADPEDDNRAPTVGERLSLADVTVGDPTHKVSHGQVWRAGEHVLVVAKLLDEHHLWSEYLTGRWFCPYPEPYITTSTIADQRSLLLVQPNVYLAGHLLDKHASVFGEHTIEHER